MKRTLFAFLALVTFCACSQTSEMEPAITINPAVDENPAAEIQPRTIQFAALVKESDKTPTTWTAENLNLTVDETSADGSACSISLFSSGASPSEIFFLLDCPTEPAPITMSFLLFEREPAEKTWTVESFSLHLNGAALDSGDDEPCLPQAILTNTHPRTLTVTLFCQGF